MPSRLSSVVWVVSGKAARLACHCSRMSRRRWVGSGGVVSSSCFLPVRSSSRSSPSCCLSLACVRMEWVSVLLPSTSLWDRVGVGFKGHRQRV